MDQIFEPGPIDARLGDIPTGPDAPSWYSVGTGEAMYEMGEEEIKILRNYYGFDEEAISNTMWYLMNHDNMTVYELFEKHLEAGTKFKVTGSYW